MKAKSRKKKTTKQSQNGKANLSNSDGINSTDKPETQDCTMDTSHEGINIQQEELEAPGVLTVPSEQEFEANLQPLDFRAIVPKTEPDFFPLNPPNVEVKTEPCVYEALQRDSGLSLKEENEEEWKEIKQEPPDENSGSLIFLLK